MRVLLFIAEYIVFRYIRTLHEVRPSSAFVRYWLVQGFKVYEISRSSNRISIDILVQEITSNQKIKESVND